MYGNTLKKIRQGKRMTQKEVCKNIVTLSYYSRIERGISIPSIELFINLLRNLNLTLDEFLFIHRNYLEEEGSKIWYELSVMFYENDIKALERKKQEFVSRNETHFLELTTFLILKLNGEIIPAEQAESVINQLMKSEDWTRIEINIFNHIMSLIPLETVLIITDRLLKSKKIYSPEKGYNSIYNKLLVNIIFLCIDNGDFVNGYKYLTNLESRLEVWDMFSKNVCLYFNGLFQFLTGQPKTGKRKIMKSFSNWDSLGMQNMSLTYKKFFEDHS
ncbi:MULTISPECIES: Rgg/GadR/MutR family transcriptional regulator [unclassified Enterococcus]|uniref:helix-turn-helix domain-containing protein n=1 Tax=unclassified Enterococcus TaxID=2608891 RepID=UPI0015560D64|nr:MULTISPECIES: Rgg/GadR/MutR family transcriptional regulator [unclassified Enterococcus]MBS7576938.1 helix-turn-helix domain-containing protein [Enterococcus sp. MMGLQ5-2]MBS7584345.1 helix-turn-helix domain-containing protein [Enterococcus sp. MMGLQ5-1]NPD12200.1 helix-turn-helix domain-containing protein [Enterococcus sp. MMGLQ5-1]NPD36772.1 helix-turn-helix domain-containing protein [Enterococcus sp. MMGLQ5-2]